MKWFKHYTNASKSETIHLLQTEFGMAKGYGLYFLLIEYLVDKWDGCSEPTFTISTRNLRKFLELSPQKWNKFIGFVSDSFQISVKNNSDFITINFPKLSEIMNKDAMSSVIRPARIRPETGLTKNKNKSKEQEEDIARTLDFSGLPAKYPKRGGADAALRICRDEITSRADFEKLSMAIENYKTYLNQTKIETKYAMSFSNFMKEWRDWIDFDPAKDETYELIEKLQKEQACLQKPSPIKS